jgi:hypothetical protein
MPNSTRGSRSALAPAHPRLRPRARVPRTHGSKRLAVLAAVLIAPTAAAADVVSLRAEIHGGGGGGVGLGGEAKDEAFFKEAPHAAYGALVGVEFLFIDVWVQHHQYTNGDRLATWTQLAAGLDVQIPFGDEGQPDVSGKRPGAKNYAELGFAVGFGLGTGQQVMPPLDKGEISDKAIIGEFDLAIGHRFGKALDLGVRVPVGIGYFIKDVANDLTDHYYGLQVQALLYLRLHVDLK